MKLIIFLNIKIINKCHAVGFKWNKRIPRTVFIGRRMLGENIIFNFVLI